MNRRRLPDLGLRPLTARSLILSALLGSTPPRLPARALVAFGSQFDIAEGTIRTALSRMVDAGEVEVAGAVYRLGPRLRRRRASQEVALHPHHDGWDGTWWFSIVDPQRRTVAERRAYRTLMLEHRMGELRPDTWLRPANLAAPPSVDSAFLVRGSMTDRRDRAVAGELWDLDALRRSGRRLVALSEDALGWLEPGDPGVLADTFLVSVAVVRFLRTEPLLPAAIVGTDWPPDRLRSLYEQLQRLHSEVMRTFVNATPGNGERPTTRVRSTRILG
ncbi:MAG: PaaX domain-containing protein, C- domain protein [Actinobacteria bacterium]|nr:PaaX domain-containing protein, C- domain protein [Actinomycetota bacterium]